MASDQEFVEYVAGQLAGVAGFRYRYMFGGCTLYSNDKVVALICDSQLFVRPTEAGRSFIGDVVEAPPYEGAKNSFLIGDQIEDSAWLSELIRISEAELPKSRQRKKKKKKPQK